MTTASKEESGYALHKAMRKYGVDNFKMEIVFCSTDEKYTLSEMEPYFIKMFESKIDKNGYNLTDGGESNFGWSPSAEAREKMSYKRKLRITSEATKEKHRQNMIKRMSDPKVREKLSKLQKERGVIPPINQNKGKKYKKKEKGAN